MNCVGGVVPPPVFNSKTNIIAMEKSPNLRQIPSKLAWDLSGQRWIGLPKGKGVMINRLFQGQNCPKPFSLPPVGLAALPLPCHFFHPPNSGNNPPKHHKGRGGSIIIFGGAKGARNPVGRVVPSLSLHHFSWRISNRK